MLEYSLAAEIFIVQVLEYSLAAEIFTVQVMEYSLATEIFTVETFITEILRLKKWIYSFIPKLSQHWMHTTASMKIDKLTPSMCNAVYHMEIDENFRAFALQRMTSFSCFIKMYRYF